MVIKYFGQKKKPKQPGKNEELKSGAAELSDIDSRETDLINMVEPFTQLLSKPKENGDKINALAVMAIVNMCNYNDKIKKIFLLKNGSKLIN